MRGFTHKIINLRTVLVQGLVAVLIGGFALASPATARAQDRVEWILGAGTSGGSMNVLSTAIATVTPKHMDGVNIRITPVDTSGSAENVRRTQSGEMQLGMSTSGTLSNGFRGEGPFEGEPHDKLRYVSLGYPVVAQYVVLADSDMEAIEDVEGKTLAATPGYNAQLFLPSLLKAAGLEEGDYRIRPMAFGDGISALRTGTVDVFGAPTDVPSASLTELATTADIRFLTFSPEVVKNVLGQNEYWISEEIPGGTYPGQDETIESVGLSVDIFTSSDVDEDVVYAFVKALAEEHADLEKTNPQGRFFTAERMVQNPSGIPLHPGAERYYREIGVLK